MIPKDLDMDHDSRRVINDYRRVINDLIRLVND
jgi:hypothetical protein